MGAFFLSRQNEKVNIRAVLELFRKNGFEEPHVFTLHNYTLLLYKKQLVDCGNFWSLGDSAVFCVGTPVYKGLSYKDTLHTALTDFTKGILDENQFLGNYCLIFYHNEQISILVDELTVQHIFVDQKLTRVSSSFLAMLSSFEYKLTLNRPAFIEKVVTGYIVGPDTLVTEISQVTPKMKSELVSQDIQFLNNTFNCDFIRKHDQGIESSVNCQVDALNAYFADISALSAENKTQIGLSGGYDSRLLFALAQKLPTDLAVYTHATEGVHEREVEIVKAILQNRPIPLTIVPTKPAWNYVGDELEHLLKACFYFFDGRSGYDMSTFSPTYTRDYRRKVIGDSRLNLNGSGGEIYRNYSHTRFSNNDWFEWMKAHVYYSNIQNVLVQKSLLQETHRLITNKISSRLGINFEKPIDYFALLRYYAEIRMPDSKSIYANAQNQLSYYLTPFIEPRILQTAYCGIPYHGMTGEYEAKLIEKLDSKLAAINSSYGFPLNSEPWSIKLKYHAKRYIPDGWINFRHLLRRRYFNAGADLLQRYRQMVLNCDYMHRTDELLRACFPEIQWDELVRANMAIPMLTNVGTFLQEFESSIRY